jgi:hypothetical protein
VTTDPNLSQPGHNRRAGDLGAASDSTMAGTLEAPARVSTTTYYTGPELWLHRLSVLAFVFVCATVGVLLVVLPWVDKWSDNHLLAGYPALQGLVASPFIRGVCSGLGLVDIWIGFWEAVHYSEEKKD